MRLDPTKLSLLEPKDIANLSRMLRADIETDDPEVACLALAVALFQIVDRHEADLHMVMSTAGNMYKAVT